MPRLTINTLGSLNIRLDGQPLTGFTTRKVQALLVYLAYYAGQPQNRAQLAAILWSESDASRANASLRQALANLRRLLPPDTITANSATITLQPGDTLQLDLMGLERDPLRYGGPFLDGFDLPRAQGWEEWLIARREQIQTQVMEQLERRGQEAFLQREARTAVAIFRRMLQIEPWREDIHRALIRSLNLDGDRAGALAQYETCRQILADEMGVEPSEKTQALRSELLTGEELTNHSLPEPATSFIGRHREVEEILQRLSDPDCRLLSLVGIGGVGKSRLALQAARRLLFDGKSSCTQDGIVFVDGLDAGQIDSLAATILTRFKLTLVDDGHIERQLVEHLQHKRLLLVLDGFEQFIESGRPLLEAIRQGAPAVQLLLTTREPLQLSWEWLYPVTGLHIGVDGEEGDDAFRLFMQRAQRVRSDFIVDAADRAAVHEICRQVDGMPLALELASAWVRMLSPQAIQGELAQGVELLASPLHDLPNRHRSLRAVFEQTWGQLTPEEQVLFSRLSLFRGGFDREAARQVLSVSLWQLSTLEAKSLLYRANRTRYHLHAALRHFAAEKLIGTDFDQTALRHADYFGRFVSSRAAEIRRSEWKEAKSTILAEIENIRSAWRRLVEQDQPEALWPFVEGLGVFYPTSGWFQEGRDFLQQACGVLRNEQTSPTGRLRLARALSWLAECLQALGARVAVEETLEEALRLLRLLDDTKGIERLLTRYAIHLQTSGSYREARHLAEESIPRMRREDDWQGLMEGLINLGEILLYQGEYAAAERTMRECEALCQRLNYRLGSAGTQSVLGDIALAQHKLETAEIHHQTTLQLCRELDYRRGIALSQQRLGRIALLQGDPVRGRSHCAEAIDLFRTANNQAGEVLTQHTLAEIALAEGQWDVAHRYLHAALSDRGQTGSMGQKLQIVLSVANLWLHTDRHDGAAGLLYFVARHPGSEAGTRRRAEALLQEIDPKTGRSGIDTNHLDLVGLCSTLR